MTRTTWFSILWISLLMVLLYLINVFWDESLSCACRLTFVSKILTLKTSVLTSTFVRWASYSTQNVFYHTLRWTSYYTKVLYLPCTWSALNVCSAEWLNDCFRTYALFCGGCPSDSAFIFLGSIDYFVHVSSQGEEMFHAHYIPLWSRFYFRLDIPSLL